MSRAKRTPQAKARTVPSVLGWRFAFVLFCLASVFTALVVRAAWLQVVEPDMLVSQGDMRTLRVENNSVLRGMITDRNGEPLAISSPVESIWVNPADAVVSKEQVEKLAKELLDKEVLHKSDVEILIGKRPFEEKKLLEIEEAELVAKTNQESLSVTETEKNEEPKTDTDTTIIV